MHQKLAPGYFVCFLGLFSACTPRPSEAVDSAAAAPRPEPPTAVATPAATPASPTPAEVEPSETRRRPPLVLTVTGPEHPQPGTTITVTAEVHRPSADGDPVELELVLPAGVRLISGSATERLSNAQREHREWVLAVDEVPAEDVRVIAATRGHRQGATAERHYRFGRPEPKLPDPQASAAPVELGNGIRTRPVPLR
jgi:hypothetical protein